MEIVLYNVRLGFANVWEPVADDNGNLKYSAAVIMPDDNPKHLEKCNEAIHAVIESAIDHGKLGKAKRKAVELPLRDGTEEVEMGKKDSSFNGSHFFNARSNRQPSLVDRQKQEITDTDEIYSGVWANVAVSFYFTKNGGTPRVAVGLNHIQKWRDDERTDGRSNVNEVFDSYEDDVDDDLI